MNLIDPRLQSITVSIYNVSCQIIEKSRSFFTPMSNPKKHKDKMKNDGVISRLAKQLIEGTK